MKKFFALFLLGGLAMCLTTSCYKDHPLKADKARSLVKKEMVRLHRDSAVTAVTVGYYECNDNDVRYMLRQLAANGLITYSCDRVKKVERVRKSRRVVRGYYIQYYDTEYYYVNDMVTTYFVDIALTDAGNAMVVEQEAIEPTADEKELRLDREVDPSQFPEAAVEYEEFPEPQAAAKGDSQAAGTVTSGKTSTVDAQAKPLSEYEIAKNKENVWAVTVRSHNVKVVKVRNIRQDNNGAVGASAEVLLEVGDVTPFGRVIDHVYDGDRQLVRDVNFVYFNDKGWRLAERD